MSTKPQLSVMSLEQEQYYTPQVYISYRPEENIRVIETIRDWFALRLGPNNIIIDVQIPPFVGSAEYYLWERIKECDIFVTIIGPDWTRLLQEHIRQGKEDRARLELRAALEENLAIVPLCIDGARPPREIDLPLELRPLIDEAFTNLGQDGSFEAQMERLIQRIRENSTQSHSEEPALDVEARFLDFERAYAHQQFTDALAILQEIENYGDMPRPFRLQVQQRIRHVKRHLQHQDGQPVYDHIKALIDMDPEQARYALQRFISKYPEVGDPERLLDGFAPLLTEEQAHLIDLLHDSNLSTEERHAVGNQLAQIGDPRQGVGLRPDGLPDIQWMRISEGDFIFHFDRKAYLPTYYISRYPITQLQFQAFVDDSGYEDDYWWEDLLIREPDVGDVRWPNSNYPRVRASWNDAVAFCRWLSERLGYEVRLPTEEEWEKAARGTLGNIYPWGNTYLAGYSNINEAVSGISNTFLRQPCSVGIFPHAASPYGVEDLIGNTWEWCLNQYNDPTVLTPDNERRVLRGGSWNSDRLFAHTARRRGELPGTRFNEVGFRIMCEELPILPKD